jgi:uncharacterized membrane protein
VAWATLPAGLYGALNGVATWGALFTIIGLAALIVGVSTPAIRWAEARPSSAPLAALLVIALALWALTELWFAARPQPLLIAPKAATLIHGLVLLALAGVTAWQLVRSRSAK